MTMVQLRRHDGRVFYTGPLPEGGLDQVREDVRRIRGTYFAQGLPWFPVTIEVYDSGDGPSVTQPPGHIPWWRRLFRRLA